MTTDTPLTLLPRRSPLCFCRSCQLKSSAPRSRASRTRAVATRPRGRSFVSVMPNKAPSDVKAPPADAKKTVSGLAYKVLKPGTGGRRPKASDQVTVHYTGWTTDGKMFDSSVVRGQPATFALDGVIKGWTEGVALMVEGEKTRFWIPEKLAYEGKQAPYGLLVFDVELIKIQ